MGYKSIRHLGLGSALMMLVVLGTNTWETLAGGSSAVHASHHGFVVSVLLSQPPGNSRGLDPGNASGRDRQSEAATSGAAHGLM